MADAACSSSMAEGRRPRSRTRMPRAIAPEVIMTTFSPPTCSSATWAQTLSRTSVRSAPSSPATMDEPSFATTVMAPSSRVELELELADDHLVAGLEPGPLKLGDHPDLTQPTLKVIQSLRVLEVVPGDEQLDAPPGHPESPVALLNHVEALLLSGSVDLMLALEVLAPLRCGLLGKRGEDRPDQVLKTHSRGG